jgi:hypothetical protein
VSINADDLPPDVRRKLGLLGKTRTKPKPSRAGVSESAPCPGHCGCTKPFPSAAAWERHARQTGCTHWRIDLDALKETP